MGCPNQLGRSGHQHTRNLTGLHQHVLRLRRQLFRLNRSIVRLTKALHGVALEKRKRECGCRKSRLVSTFHNNVQINLEIGGSYE